MKLISIVVALLLLGNLSAQVPSSKNKKAEKYFAGAQHYFQAGENHRAIGELEKALQEDACYVDALLLMADIYRELRNDSLQVVYLETASKLGTEHAAKIDYVLGNTYYRQGKYDKSREHFQSFLSNSTEKNSMYPKAVEKLVQCEFALSLIENVVEFNAVSLGENVNSDFNDYWPSLTADGQTIIFTRLVGENGGSSVTGRFQEDFFISDFSDGEWQPAKPVQSLNTPDNEGAQSISADGKLLFFTACTQSGGYGSCDIYFSRNIGGTWTKPRNAGAPVNSPAWESQPSISANGEYLYFVSNRQGGVGGMDIWRCRLNDFYATGEPRWGQPQNLGETINTSGNETSPFIHADGKTLYFASDKLLGLGGFDLFYSVLTGESAWKTPVNLGYPINTHKDEQGLVVEASGTRAYYSSDRPGSNGVDIYRFDLYEQARPTPVSYVKGKVFDKKSGHPVSAQIELVDVDKDKLMGKTASDQANGEFLMCLPLGNEYAFNVSKSGYLFYSENFALKEASDANNPFYLDIALEAIEIGNTTVLRNIFFDTGKFELLETSKTELGKLVDFMEKNPKVKIEIGGHTDNVGSAELNRELSHNRAKSVYNYLINSGVEAGRLNYQGYGFSVPVAPNDSDEGRAQNRRTEFKVVSKD